MNNNLINEINTIREMMGLLTEEETKMDQASDLSKIQNLSDLEGLNIEVKNVLDKTNPICSAPKTGNQEHDTIISKVWDWANDPQNKTKLKDTFKKVKDTFLSLKKTQKKGEVNEQVTGAIIIGGIAISPGILIAIGVFILIIIILAMIPKKSKCKKWKNLNDLL
jgi:hypothetical protein